MNEQTNHPWIDIAGVNLYKLGEFSHDPRFVYMTTKEYDAIKGLEHSMDNIKKKFYGKKPTELISPTKECVDCHELKPLFYFSSYARKNRVKNKVMPMCKRCQNIRHKKSYVTKEQKVALGIIELIHEKQVIEQIIDAINNKYFTL